MRVLSKLHTLAQHGYAHQNKHLSPIHDAGHETLQTLMSVHHGKCQYVCIPKRDFVRVLAKPQMDKHIKTKTNTHHLYMTRAMKHRCFGARKTIVPACTCARSFHAWKLRIFVRNASRLCRLAAIWRLCACASFIFHILLLSRRHACMHSTSLISSSIYQHMPMHTHTDT